MLKLGVNHLHLLGFFNSFVDRADHVESLFRQRVVFTVDDFFKTADRFLQGDVAARLPGEGLRDKEWLRQEFLYLACTANPRMAIMSCMSLYF